MNLGSPRTTYDDKDLREASVKTKIPTVQLLTKFTENGNVTSKSTKQSVSSGELLLASPY